MRVCVSVLVTLVMQPRHQMVLLCLCFNHSEFEAGTCGLRRVPPQLALYLSRANQLRWGHQPLRNAVISFATAFGMRVSF